MKDSKEYSNKLKKLYSQLKNTYPKPSVVKYDDPVKAIVHGIISENMSLADYEIAAKKLEENFVDLNDLRVSSAEDIVDMLGKDNPTAGETAATLKKLLGDIFEKHNRISLESLKKLGKRPARKIVEDIVGGSKFVADYCMLTSLGGHAIPLTKKMLEYLKKNEIVHPEANEEEIEGFLTRQISAQKAYEFYVLLRSQSELAKVKVAAKKTKTAGQKTVKKKG